MMGRLANKEFFAFVTTTNVNMTRFHPKNRGIVEAPMSPFRVRFILTFPS